MLSLKCDKSTMKTGKNHIVLLVSKDNNNAFGLHHAKPTSTCDLHIRVYRWCISQGPLPSRAASHGILCKSPQDGLCSMLSLVLEQSERGQEIEELWQQSKVSAIGAVLGGAALATCSAFPTCNVDLDRAARRRCAGQGAYGDPC